MEQETQAIAVSVDNDELFVIERLQYGAFQHDVIDVGGGSGCNCNCNSNCNGSSEEPID